MPLFLIPVAVVGKVWWDNHQKKKQGDDEEQQGEEEEESASTTVDGEPSRVVDTLPCDTHDSTAKLRKEESTLQDSSSDETLEMNSSMFSRNQCSLKRHFLHFYLEWGIYTETQQSNPRQGLMHGR